MAGGDQGHIKIARKYFESAEWTDGREFSCQEAWIDVIQLAAYKPHTRTIAGEKIELERGEFRASVRYLARRWSWHRNRVSRQLRKWLDEGRIAKLLWDSKRDTNRDTKRDTYLIPNYDTYQRTRDSDRDSNRDTKRDKEEARIKRSKNSEKQEEGEVAPRSDDGPSAPAPLSREEAREAAREVLAFYPAIRGARNNPVDSPHPCSLLWPLTRSFLAELQNTFPGVDVRKEAREALLWCRVESSKRKTWGGMTRFLLRWMRREQNNLERKANWRGREEKPNPAHRRVLSRRQ